MVRHIQFCLSEIEYEIEAQGADGLSEGERSELSGHVAAMRCLLAGFAARKAAVALAMSRDDRTSPGEIHDARKACQPAEFGSGALAAVRAVLSATNASPPKVAAEGPKDIIVQLPRPMTEAKPSTKAESKDVSQSIAAGRVVPQTLSGAGKSARRTSRAGSLVVAAAICALAYLNVPVFLRP